MRDEKVIWSGREENRRVSVLYASGRIEPAWDTPISCANAMEDLATAYAKAHAETERIRAAARRVLAFLHDKEAPFVAGDLGVEDPSGINEALDRLAASVEGT